ncbi:hypothetical protein Clacol_000841 [Clathrus columnatus]|uniref:O-methyltransferase C-terminal domain-containing protein n=1 Tax=Clathrus columnatus TaxID=1419009 RepID=A0AAV4ZX98_9AGAM|nr:hypothetical protein Clacol_000841 [Clathrus columnatus]
MTLSKLHDLLNLLTDAVTQLEEACTKNGTSIPDLDKSFNTSSEDFRKDPTAALAANVIGAAALHIYAIINPPQISLFDIASGTQKAAALRICLESGVAEILQEAGPQGLHISDITTINGQDPVKLGACLRYMATHHVFREVTPNVFANSRISSLLDTGKSFQELLSYPHKKYENTSGLTALIGHLLDEASTASAHMWEVFSDPTTVKSNEPSQSAFTKFVGRGKTLWEYYDDPEQDFRRHRFNIGMHGIQKLHPENIILSVYDWKAVPAGSVIVDVGGGVGTTQLCLAKEFPQLKIIIQDQSHVIEEGAKASTLICQTLILNVWHEKDPDALQSGRVSFEDEYCIKILTQLRKAASPNTKLLSMDTIIQHACHDNSGFTDYITGAMPDEAPSPLLANWGAVNPMAYCIDIIMLALFNSRERTLSDSVSLFEKSGWKVTEPDADE